MKKILLIVLSFVSLQLAAFDVVQTKVSYPQYAGYISIPATTQQIFDEILKEIEGDDSNIYEINRDEYSVIVMDNEYEDGIRILTKIKFTAAPNCLKYAVLVRLTDKKGVDITDAFKNTDIAEEMDEIVRELLDEFTDLF